MTATNYSLSFVRPETAQWPLIGELTILYFPHPGLQIVQCQVADLVFETVEIHGEVWG